MLNHKIYADRHGYRYRYDQTPSRGIGRPYFHKIAKIADALIDTEWLFWIDDDAAFTQLARSFESLVPELADPNAHIVFCASPVNPRGIWTHVSSGNFFVRNSTIGREFIALAQESLLPTVEAWWDADKYGYFTRGDQDVLVYLMETLPHIGSSTKILEYQRFNTRPYHFKCAHDYFIVHFTQQPGTTKAEQMRHFAATFQLTDFLVPQSELSPYRRYVKPILEASGFGDAHTRAVADQVGSEAP